MTKEEYVGYVNANNYPLSVFENYFKEVSDKEWNASAFKAFIQNKQFMEPDYLTIALQNKIMPFYNQKFKIYPVTLLDKEGKFIKLLNEITEED